MAWYFYLLVFAILLAILFNVSKICEFYMKCIFFYLCVFLHGIESQVTMIPSYFRCAGADLIFHTFKYWCYWTGVQVEVRGFEEYLANMDQPAVVVANHQSFIDIVAMCYVWPPRGVVMMKTSLKYVPFFNFASKLAHSIYVNRYNHAQAMRAVDECVEQLKAKGHKLWIFPEGTRNTKGGLLPFKKGGFNIAAQIPIIPIVLSDFRPFYSETEKYFKNDGIIIAKVLPPISTEGKTLDDVIELTEQVRSEMLKVYNEISPEAKDMMEKRRKEKV